MLAKKKSSKKKKKNKVKQGENTKQHIIGEAELNLNDNSIHNLNLESQSKPNLNNESQSEPSLINELQIDHNLNNENLLQNQEIQIDNDIKNEAQNQTQMISTDKKDDEKELLKARIMQLEDKNQQLIKFYANKLEKIREVLITEHNYRISTEKSIETMQADFQNRYLTLKKEKDNLSFSLSLMSMELAKYHKLYESQLAINKTINKLLLEKQSIEDISAYNTGIKSHNDFDFSDKSSNELIDSILPIQENSDSKLSDSYSDSLQMFQKPFQL